MPTGSAEERRLFMYNTPNETQGQSDFIMCPTVDVCFAGLMENPIVRKGFCAAIMRVSPNMIDETELLPTHIHREYAQDKLGILDVLVRLKSGLQINMEMQVKYFEFWDERALFYLSKMFSGQLKHGDSYEKLQKCIHVSILDFIRFPEDSSCYRTIHFRNDETGDIYTDKFELQFLELKKLPKEIQTEEDIINWMRFFNGKSREEFELMAKTDVYLGEAYEALQRLSADEKKRLEYEERDKALKDYNTQMASAERRGWNNGEKHGQKAGIQLACKVLSMHAQGKSMEEIVLACDLTIDTVQVILESAHGLENR